MWKIRRVDSRIDRNGRIIYTSSVTLRATPSPAGEGFVCAVSEADDRWSSLGGYADKRTVEDAGPYEINVVL